MSDTEDPVPDLRWRAGGQAIAVQADVSDEDQVRALFEATAQAVGRIDILVANSGIQQDAPFETASCMWLMNVGSFTNKLSR